MKLKPQKKESVKNIEEGLSNEWYISPLPRKELKPFTRRSDWPAIKHFGGYFLLLISTGILAYNFLESIQSQTLTHLIQIYQDKRGQYRQ